jgi:NIMA (never in mitosis gene a)-related kinase
MLEVNLLKDLNHPHIVSYKQSYFTLDLLIIIMEYCEVGDLSYHIQRKIKKGEFFSETQIFNWFIQICLALEYVHGRRVIHRDLKAKNIFLTGNLNVKLGDFGISKVLDNSNAAAVTVVGTPYYLSPEACQSQPYTSKSDVWSLGVILYELCTLKNPFEADNLLGLVFKIVQEKHDPIPDRYSADLRNLIDMLLEKDPIKRPTARDILKMDLIRRKAEEFVAENQSNQNNVPTVYKKNMPTVRKVEEKKEEE